MRFDNIFDRKLIKNIDIGIVVSTVLLIIIGMIAISSATHTSAGGLSGELKVQITAFILGLFAVLFILVIDYKSFGEIHWALYVISIVLLLLVIFVGKTSHGAKNWIRFGTFGFQPAEIVKIGFVLSFSKFLEKRKDNLDSIVQVAPCVGYIMVPIGLIVLQPDMGTALVFIFISAFMLFAAGINYKYILGAFGALVISMPILWAFILKEYQKNRILAFFDPNLDPMGTGYNVIQSKIAIGSGQFLGKGLYKGTQNNLGFIPEKHTDFIFSIIGEELGLVGTVIVALLFLWLLLRCIHIAKVSKDDYGMLVCVGLTSMFLFHVLENIGMTIGIMPVTGIPLPFISYGGTSLLTNMVAIALIINIGMRRQVIRF